MSRTKIVATYGPACDKESVFADMLAAGMDVVRLNVSHLEPKDLPETAARLRKWAANAAQPLAVLADMPGPKIRLSLCEPEQIRLQEGDQVQLFPGNKVSSPERLYVEYRYLLEDVRAGHEIAINDGLVLLRVQSVNKDRGCLVAKVLQGGQVASRKGVSFLHSTLRVGGLTKRDREGLKAAAVAQVDFIALSFVRSAKDIAAARRVLKREGAEDIPLVAKIEQHEAIDHFLEILDASEGVMVARGDMGIERPLEQVPLLQKDIIALCNQRGRFVITATQMLESMIENARPTRAEVTDVANAILDGTDGVMLSAETAVGRDPANVVRMMGRVAGTAESRIDPAEWLRELDPIGDNPDAEDVGDLDDALAHAACSLALSAPLDGLVCFSFYGSTARRIARYRPACPIYVLSPYEEYCRRLAISWGVEVFRFSEAAPASERDMYHPGKLIEPALELLKARRCLKKGMRLAFLAGVPLDVESRNTNWLRVVEY